MPAMLTPLLSSCVAPPGTMCKKFGSEPTVLTNVGFSENDAVSRGDTCDHIPPRVGYALTPS